MRRRVAAGAAVALVATVLASGCTDDEHAGPVSDRAPSASPAGSAVASDVPDSTPPATLHLATGDLALAPYTSCWTTDGSGMCADGAPQEPLAHAGRTDALEFTFPVPGWTFQATFRPEGSTTSRDTGPCERPRTVRLEQSPDNRFHLEPVGPAGTYDVELFGRGPQGDWAGAFRWQTSRPGPEPLATSTVSIVWDPHGSVDGGHGSSLSVGGLSTTPTTATARVTATAANGETITFDAGTPRLGCPAAGSVLFQEQGDALSQRVAALGPAPFTYGVTLLLDGDTHRAEATWPDDHVDDPFNDDPAPVPLYFEPPLPCC